LHPSTPLGCVALSSWGIARNGRKVWLKRLHPTTNSFLVRFIISRFATHSSTGA
jgi:hypothetical protein